MTMNLILMSPGIYHLMPAPHPKWKRKRKEKKTLRAVHHHLVRQAGYLQALSKKNPSKNGCNLASHLDADASASHYDDDNKTLIHQRPPHKSGRSWP
ncbi:hypothetical protein NC652_013868 [Populus alba x Populus x berolinensis]|nr:hypothetical protein NC652_013868 [Populus alba x Populus x berolinensis]